MAKCNDDGKHLAKPVHKPARKRVTTINDILSRDEITGMVADLQAQKPDIKDLVIIYTDGASVYHWSISEDTLMSTAIWMLESTKNDLLNNQNE